MSYSMGQFRARRSRFQRYTLPDYSGGAGPGAPPPPGGDERSAPGDESDYGSEAGPGGGPLGTVSSSKTVLLLGGVFLAVTALGLLPKKMYDRSSVLGSIHNLISKKKYHYKEPGLFTARPAGYW